MYISATEEANFWFQVLPDLNQRGLKDILIACTDNLKGFTEAILGIYPKAQVATVHCTPNTQLTQHIASKNQKEFMRDLKLVYRATGKQVAEEALLNSV